MKSTLAAPSLARSGAGQAGSDSLRVRPMRPGNAVPAWYSFSAIEVSLPVQSSLRIVPIRPAHVVGRATTWKAYAGSPVDATPRGFETVSATRGAWPTGAGPSAWPSRRRAPSRLAVWRRAPLAAGDALPERARSGERSRRIWHSRPHHGEVKLTR